jgi:hypothetical protein
VNNDYRYPWPASGLTPNEMALLHTAREESGRPRTPITRLIARAVRETYGGHAEPVTG